MNPWVLLIVHAVSAVEVDVTGPVIDPSATEWTRVYVIQNNVSGSVEIDLDVHAYRSGIIGSSIDVFSLLFPSHYDVQIRSGSPKEIVVFNQSFNTSLGSISTVVPAQTGPIGIWLRNRNSVFSIQPWLNGEVFSSSSQFDLRTRYPACPFPVYSQQMCGACYADVVAGAGTDDLCISNAGSPIASKLSPQSIISCSNLGGCAGGSPYLAAQWTANNGLTELKDCPFQSGQCAPSDDYERDGCVACSALRMTNLASSFRFSPIALYPGSEYAMRNHIETRGSVMVIFVAHTNFQEFFYTHPFGVYKDVAGSPALGNHAVRLVGFGVEGDTRYWIAINSWGNDWANRGSFKIVRGENFCLIEQYPVGIQHIDHVTAGIGSETENVQHPTVGGWTPQDPEGIYWKRFVEKNRDEIMRELGTTTLSVSNVETKVTHGFHVRITANEGVVHIHVAPSGTVDIVSKKPKLNPENLQSVLVH
jgi:cathepsin B